VIGRSRIRFPVALAIAAAVSVMPVSQCRRFFKQQQALAQLAVSRYQFANALLLSRQCVLPKS
jgi:hypothetical protein